MGLQITFLTCNLGSERRVVEAFGKRVELFEDRGLTHEEHDNATKFLQGLERSDPDEDDWYSVTLSDAKVQIHWAIEPNQPFDVGVVEISETTSAVCDFLFGLSRAANMYMQIPLNEMITVAVSEDQLAAIRERYPQAQLVSNDTEFNLLLEKNATAPTRKPNPSLWRRLLNIFR